ncbi:MAG: hypothetical protein MJZ61_03515 [Bacteroidales bacterium]|nr:hypothetical protein [Bacteroidales bacterium]
MRRFLTLAIALLCCANVFAQYSTSKSNMWYPVRTFPKYYVPENNRNYSIDCRLSRQIAEFANTGELENRLLFQDWREEENADNAYLKIYLESFDFIIEAMREVEMHEMVKEHGVEHERIFFMPQIDYSMVINWGLIHGDMREQHTNINPDTRRPNISSFQIDKHFHSPRECHEYMRENKEVFIEKIINSELMATTEQVQEALAASFHYGSSNWSVKIALFNNKKSSYYNKHHAGKDELKSIFSNMPLEGPITNTIKDLQPWIDHFKEIEASLSSADKKQKEAKADMIYNLAQIYMALEIYDVAKQYAMQLYNEYGDNSGKRILREILGEEEELKKHHLVSRHF